MTEPVEESSPGHAGGKQIEEEDNWSVHLLPACSTPVHISSCVRLAHRLLPAPLKVVEHTGSQSMSCSPDAIQLAGAYGRMPPSYPTPCQL